MSVEQRDTTVREAGPETWQDFEFDGYVHSQAELEAVLRRRSRERPVVDNRPMVLFWVAFALGFALALAVTAYLVAQRGAGG